jgi:hypothetical protein
MTGKLLNKILAIPLLLSGMVVATETASQAQSNRLSFFCGTYQGYPATVARHPQRGNVALISWRSNHFGDAYPPARRCQEVSARFNTAYQQGNLKYILPGKYKNQAVLCASSNPPRYPLINCPSNRVLLTLSPKPEYPTIASLAQNAVRAIARANSDVSNSGSVWRETNCLDENPDGSIGINVDRMIIGGVETQE